MQINIIDEEMSARSGTSIRGVGRAITCEPKTRGCARLNNNAEKTEMLKREVPEVKEVARKSRDDYNALFERIREIDSLIRSIQAGGQQAAVPTPALAPATQSSCNLHADQDSNL